MPSTHIFPLIFRLVGPTNFTYCEVTPSIKLVLENLLYSWHRQMPLKQGYNMLIYQNKNLFFHKFIVNHLSG